VGDDQVATRQRGWDTALGVIVYDDMDRSIVGGR
jgi:hypothetical protein